MSAKDVADMVQARVGPVAQNNREIKSLGNQAAHSDSSLSPDGLQFVAVICNGETKSIRVFNPAPTSFILNMTDPKPVMSSLPLLEFMFDRRQDPTNHGVIESHCFVCKRLVAASRDADILKIAEGVHRLPPHSEPDQRHGLGSLSRVIHRIPCAVVNLNHQTSLYFFS